MYRINRNSLSDKKNKPFLLKPVGKDYLWGGDRLNYDFGKNIPLSPLSETWECSTHLDGPAAVLFSMMVRLCLSSRATASLFRQIRSKCTFMERLHYSK